MTFHLPHLLWLLVVPVLLALLEARRRPGTAAASTHPKIRRAEAGTQDLQLEAARTVEEPVRPKTQLRWRLHLALAFFALSLARPQWGHVDEPVFDQAREIVIALDLSRSMLATDIAPSRLDRAKLLVTSLLERLSGERVGLIVFAGTAFLQSPLSSDYEILNEFLPTLSPDFLPQGGSNYQALINDAVSAFSASGSADRFLIVLSDGEATDDSWRQAAGTLKERGIRALTLGVGTAEGSILPDPKGGYIKDDSGAVVLSKLQSATLEELASLSGGRYVDASTWVDLAQLLESTVEAGRKGDFREERQVRLVERFQWALAPALCLFLWSLLREFPVHPRPRTVQLKPTGQKGLAAGLTLLGLVWFAADSPLGAAETKTSAAAEPLSKLVAQFSTRDALAARDYAELARTTLDYAKRSSANQEPPAEGAIRDGLQAVRAGASLDEKAADWDRLRQELEAFLAKPPEPTPPPEQPEQQDEEQKPEDSQQQPKQDQKQSGQEPPKDEKPGSSEQKQDGSNPESSPKDSPPQTKESETPPPQSAFGDMQPKEGEAPKPTPTPTPGNATPETQKVGGAPDGKGEPPVDPSLVVPLERLQRVRNQDSPVRLQELMRGDGGAEAPVGKNW